MQGADSKNYSGGKSEESVSTPPHGSSKNQYPMPQVTSGGTQNEASVSLENLKSVGLSGSGGDITPDLYTLLYLPTQLVGCQRRMHWDPYRPGLNMYRGVPFLFAIGAERVRFDTPVGPSWHFLLEGSTIIYRAGPFRGWWFEDLCVEAAITGTTTGVIMHDFDNHINLQHHRDLVSYDMKMLVKNAREATRWPKQTERALHVCRNCPVKRECDAKDREEGKTDDWAPNYPFP